MSYGKELKIDGLDYLIEIFDKNIYVAKKNGEDDYTSIYEGDYELFFSADELSELKQLDYEDSLYTICMYCIEKHGIVNYRSLYEDYIHELIKIDSRKEEILSSSSDECYVYDLFFPLDRERNNFEKITSLIIDEYQINNK